MWLFQYLGNQPHRTPPQETPAPARPHPPPLKSELQHLERGPSSQLLSVKSSSSSLCSLRPRGSSCSPIAPRGRPQHLLLPLEPTSQHFYTSSSVFTLTPVLAEAGVLPAPESLPCYLQCSQNHFLLRPVGFRKVSTLPRVPRLVTKRLVFKEKQTLAPHSGP